MVPKPEMKSSTTAPAAAEFNRWLIPVAAVCHSHLHRFGLCLEHV